MNATRKWPRAVALALAIGLATLLCVPAVAVAEPLPTLTVFEMGRGAEAQYKAEAPDGSVLVVSIGGVTSRGFSWVGGYQPPSNASITSNAGAIVEIYTPAHDGEPETFVSITGGGLPDLLEIDPRLATAELDLTTAYSEIWGGSRDVWYDVMPWETEGRDPDETGFESLHVQVEWEATGPAMHDQEVGHTREDEIFYVGNSNGAERVASAHGTVVGEIGGTYFSGDFDGGRIFWNRAVYHVNGEW